MPDSKKGDFNDPFSTVVRREGTVDPRTVERFHETADTDSEQMSIHHTLGPGHSQASPGDHLHDGSSSKLLMSSVTITGSKGGNVALGNLISALAAALGFVDSTT